MQDQDPPAERPSARAAFAAGRAAGRLFQRRYRDLPLRSQTGARLEARGDGLTAEAIETQLREGYRWLRFTPSLEDRFETDLGAERRRHLSAISVVGVLVYGFLSLNDATLLPDVLQQARRQLLIVVPVLLLTALLVRWARAPWLRESALSLAVGGLSLSVLGLLAQSHALTALTHSAAFVLVPMFAGMAARLRFWYSVAVSLLTLIGYVLILHGRNQQEALMVADFSSILLSATVFSLIASYSVEYRDRTAWLLRQLEKRRRLALAEANERLRKLSMCDSLTGIPNRRQFDLDLAARWLRAVRLRQPVALMLIDIDHFKRYNDCYGHPAGDACLQRIAARLNDMAEGCGGVAARLGGEEFAVIVAPADAGDAASHAERFRAGIAALGIEHAQAGSERVVTASIGVAVACPALDDSHVGLIEIADRVLYQAKTAGRNRVVVASAPMAVSTPRRFGD